MHFSGSCLYIVAGLAVLDAVCANMAPISVPTFPSTGTQDSPKAPVDFTGLFRSCGRVNGFVCRDGEECYDPEDDGVGYCVPRSSASAPRAPEDAASSTDAPTAKAPSARTPAGNSAAKAPANAAFPKGPTNLSANFRSCNGPGDVPCPDSAECVTDNNGNGFCMPRNGAPSAKGPTNLADTPTAKTPSAKTPPGDAPIAAAPTNAPAAKGPTDIAANFRPCNGPTDLPCPASSECMITDDNGSGVCMPRNGAQAPKAPTDLAGPTETPSAKTPSAKTPSENAPVAAAPTNTPSAKGPTDIAANFRPCNGPTDLPCPASSECMITDDNGNGVCMPRNGAPAAKAPGSVENPAQAPADRPQFPQGTENFMEGAQPPRPITCNVAAADGNSCPAGLRCVQTEGSSSGVCRRAQLTADSPRTCGGEQNIRCPPGFNCQLDTLALTQGPPIGVCV